MVPPPTFIRVCKYLLFLENSWPLEYFYPYHYSRPVPTVVTVVVVVVDVVGVNEP
jgi:hypothetical protein